MSVQFLVGCDPEVFVRDSKTGSLISAHDLLPGSKASAHRVNDGAVQPDGLAAEFNIDPVPLNDFETFNNRVTAVMGQMRDVIKAVNPDAGLVLTPSAQFDAAYYASLPDSAKELGCDPDFCAYSDDPFEPNKRPDGASGLRSAAGHIHVGWGSGIPTDNAEHVEICRGFIRNLDVFVGLAMTCIDGDDKRRELYGKAGAYRPKAYGVEYRTPSNVWLRSKAARRFIHDMVTRAISDMQTSNPAYLTLAAEGYDVESIINDGDRKTAKALLSDRFYVRVPADLEVKA